MVTLLFSAEIRSTYRGMQFAPAPPKIFRTQAVQLT